jgi:hypothetical protein
MARMGRRARTSEEARAPKGSTEGDKQEAWRDEGCLPRCVVEEVKERRCK